MVTNGNIIRNNVTDALLTRRTVRDYAPTPLSEDALETLLQCALLAPSARNQQPCIIRALLGKERLDALNHDFKETVGWDTPAYTRWDVNPVYQTAPAMIFLFALRDAQLDAGIMVENIAVAAKGLGLDSCIIGSVGALFEGPYGDKWKDILQVERDARFMISVAVGEGREQPPVKERHEDQCKVIR